MTLSQLRKDPFVNGFLTAAREQSVDTCIRCLAHLQRMIEQGRNLDRATRAQTLNAAEALSLDIDRRQKSELGSAATNPGD